MTVTAHDFFNSKTFRSMPRPKPILTRLG